jgi:hypothetical protein
MDTAAKDEISDFSEFITPVCELLKQVSESETRVLTELKNNI